jgi:hypothetical protein
MYVHIHRQSGTIMLAYNLDMLCGKRSGVDRPSVEVILQRWERYDVV